ncbi:MAG: nucleotidyltransferase [Alphaproteobacteria bacterium]|nr:nucleotidyltransferase [Alphaproteobacteria bacterium]
MSQVKAVIQAGGQGTRLYPYSTVLPKALMPLGEGTVADKLMAMFAAADIHHIYVTLSEQNKICNLIKSYCGDGSRWGVRIEYVTEELPLGTIGPLLPMRDRLDTTFIVSNSDVSVDIDLRDFVDFHCSADVLLTIAVAKQQVSIDYGVIEHDSGRVSGFREKPTEEFCVSTGIYCMSPRVLNFVPQGRLFGFDDLIAALLENDQPVMIYDRTENWIDIGRIEDLRRAQEQAAKGLYQE